MLRWEIVKVRISLSIFSGRDVLIIRETFPYIIARKVPNVDPESQRMIGSVRNKEEEAS